MYKLTAILTAVLFSGHAFGASLLTADSFPKTAADATFTARTENAAAGYEPFKDASAYDPLILEAEEKEYERQINRMNAIADQDAMTMTPAEYCNKYPTDALRCTQTPTTFADVVAIADAPAPMVPAPVAPTQNVTTPAQTPQPIASVAGGGASPYNNRLHGHKCTPPARSNWFPNKILTTGRYESIDSAFEKGMITIFRKEGGCASVRGDRGDYTCYGISSVANPDVNMRTLTRGGAEDIAHDRYYAKYNMDKLPDSVRGDVLQAGWGSGPVTGINLFRGMFNLNRNGRVDADLIAAAENYQGDLHNDFLNVLRDHYVAVSKRGENSRFLKGWMEGVRLFRENGCLVEPATPLYRK